MVSIFGFQHNHIPREATFVLTQLGESKADNYTGDERTRLLLVLRTNGASNTDEISRLAKISKGKVEKMIPILIKGGYIQPIKGEM